MFCAQWWSNFRIRIRAPNVYNEPHNLLGSPGRAHVDGCTRCQLRKSHLIQERHDFTKLMWLWFPIDAMPRRWREVEGLLEVYQVVVTLSVKINKQGVYLVPPNPFFCDRSPLGGYRWPNSKSLGHSPHFTTCRPCNGHETESTTLYLFFVTPTYYSQKADSHW